jgi:TfoX/Sxy family transcriptional regulator of competence genes
MTTAPAREQALDIADNLHSIGPVDVTRFFGGAGLTAEGRQPGFVMKGTLYLRVDDMSRPMFEEMGAGPFTYQNGLRTVTVGTYYQVPDEIAAEPAELARWALEARRAAQAASSARRRVRHSRPRFPS